jgi:Cd2+/Zn2+-exporting ATPase
VNLPDHSVRYTITGIHCGGCADKIEHAINRLPGIHDAHISSINQSLSLRYDHDEGLHGLEPVVTDLGYGIRRLDTGGPTHTHREPDHDHGRGAHSHIHSQGGGSWWKGRQATALVVVAAALGAAYGLNYLVPSAGPWAFIAALLIGLVPIARRAISAARAGSPFSIEMLMTVAAVGAVLIGALEEAATVIFLFLIGELLEGVAAERARAGIKALADLVPKVALVEADGQTVEHPVESLVVGMVVLVRPGDRIPADGQIITGESTINEAPITGESTPIRKHAESLVFAGTINGDGVLRIRVTAVAADNTIARVIRLVEEAQESKAPTQRFIDRFSRYYTPAVVCVAALVAIVPPLLFPGAGWDVWIYRGLAILLIGCPCALVISTPAAIAAALAAGARRGLLLKGGAVLETVGRVSIVAFDKTGTLTEGRPVVTDVLSFARAEPDVLRLAAALEAGSSHPLALAILAEARARGIATTAVKQSEALGGKGVQGRVENINVFLGSPIAARDLAEMTADQLARIDALNAEGKSVAVLVADGMIAGVIGMRDEPRADAIDGLSALMDAGIRTVMLTGDNRRTAEAVGVRLGIEVKAELLPADKLRIVQQLRQGGAIVAKVGDGINDAPALAAADVGIAMGSGTDVALETADAAILHGRVADVAAMVKLSRRTMANIHQNITIAIGLKAVFLVTTIIGLTGLWPAILADTGATVFVTLNALRLLRFGPTA